MHHTSFRTTIRALAALSIALLIAGCGAGGTTDSLVGPTSPPVTSASLTGQVMEIDGETTALGGVALTLAETGQTAVTASDGTFDFGAVPTGTLSLAVAADPSANLVVLSNGSGSDSGGSDGDSGHASDDDSGQNGEGAEDDDAGQNGHHDADDIEDGEDLDHDGMHVHRAEHQEQIRVRVRICDGEVCEMQVRRGGHEEREVEVRMTRTEDSVDTDIEGKVELESRDDRERFKVRVEQADEDLVLEVLVISPSDEVESIGTRTVGLGGEARWTLDTSTGARLPFGVDSVDELEDYIVEVVDFDTETTLLTATLPEMPDALADDDDDSDDDGDDGDDDDGNGTETRMRSRARLEAHEPGAEGCVELRSRPSDGEEKFEMEAENLASGREVTFELETGERTGQFSRLRTMTVNQEGESELEINTRHGDTLPNNAQGVRDLVRLRTQVRDAKTDEVILSGTVPELVLDD